MVRTRFSPIVLGLALTALACDGGGGGTRKPDDAGMDQDPVGGDDGGSDMPGMDAGDGDGDGDTGDGDGQEDAGPDAAPVCITGCDEVGAECGVIDDNCGGTID